MRLNALVPLLPCAHASLAAYVQARACLASLDHDGQEVSTHRAFRAVGLRASLTFVPEHHHLPRLRLTVRGEPTSMACEETKLSNVTSSVRITSLGSSLTFPGVLESSDCEHPVPSQSSTSRLQFAYDIAPAHFLDTYWLTVELLDEDGPLSCIKAFLTPDVGQAVSQTATWAPVAIFAIVLVSGLWKECRTLFASSAGGFDGAGHSNRERRRAHIIRIGDCLSYLQFIFFTGSLTLSYPGFLRPVVSSMSWSTLMFPVGLVAHKSWYDGVQDGIYEVNGTFGGTDGLELTTQVIGGTITTDTWLNIITLAASLFFLILGLMVLGRRLADGRRDIFKDKDSIGFGAEDGFTISAAFLAALRLFCSYLLLPLVAWSTYILSYANGIDIYYTAAASAMVSCLVALVWFAMWRSSPRRMGYLLVDGIHKPRNTPHPSRMQDVYAASVFIFLFLRGATIGGLQQAGLLQLVVLMAIEFIQVMLFAFSHLQNPLASHTGIMPALRTLSLFLDLAFVPGSASFSGQVILGFAVLFVHSLVLVFLFFLPAMHDLYLLARRSPASSTQDVGGSGPDADEQPVYTLRQIMKRPTRDPTPEPILDGDSPCVPSRCSPVSQVQDFATSPSDRSSRASFFRSPRHNPCVGSSSRTSYAGPSTCSSPTGSSALESSSDGSDIGTMVGHGNGDSFISLRIDPKVDYSFREADLYYHQPRVKTFGDDGGDQGEKRKSGLRLMTAFPFKK